MAGDKSAHTEKATPKRRSEARKKGQVARSVEVNSALIILALFVAIRAFGQNIYTSLSDLMRFFLSSPASYELNEKTVASLFLSLALLFLKIVLPIALVALVVGVIANIAQIGFMFTSKPLVPDAKKISPLSGASRLFSGRSMVELIKSSLKLIVIGFTAYSVIRGRYSDIVTTLDMDIWDTLAVFGSILYDVGIRVGVTLLIMALFDYMYQRYSFEKSIRMTKQEIKEEYRQMEGDPQVKAQIRRKQQEMAAARMMQAVPTADVVITNPTRLAIALKYDTETMAAPKVVAKGQRLIAEKIRELAKENNVPIVEDKLLAQSLFKTVDVDREVPYDLYKAVAEILAYVYQLNRGVKRNN
ncbi:MAG: flagellar biosynthesis protein FlhB, partial [Candidatus Aquicultor sp.]